MDFSYALLRDNRQNGKLLPDVFGVIDRGRMTCADYDDTDLHNCFYDGYTEHS